MTWHILHFVYCIGYGARAASYCQEASSFYSLRWIRWLARGKGGTLTREGCQGPQWYPQRCPWRAGSSLQVASWAQPSALPQEAECLWKRRRERALLCITAKTGLDNEKTIFLRYPSAFRKKERNVEKARHVSRWEFCLRMSGPYVCCVGAATLSACISVLSSAIASMWDVTHKQDGEWVKKRQNSNSNWQVENGGMVSQSSGHTVEDTETFCRCRLVANAHCWRTWKTSHIWRMTQTFFSAACHTATQSTMTQEASPSLLHFCLSATAPLNICSPPLRCIDRGREGDAFFKTM